MKLRFLFFVFLSISFRSIAQDIHSLSLQAPVIIDGNPDEWPQPFRYYDSGTKLQFAMANDTSNIYICLKVTDEPAQMKLMHAGMTLWIDAKGKKKEVTGITFPVKQEHNAESEIQHQQSRGEGQIPGQTFQKHDFSQFKIRVASQQTTIRLKGFTGIAEEAAPLQNNFHINVAFGWDTFNILCIEYQIPVALVLNHGLTSADTLKPLGIGFVVNALETSSNWGGSEHHNRSDADGVDMTGSNNFGNMNGGMNNGMNGGMNRSPRTGSVNNGEGYTGGSNYNEAAQEHKVWSRLILNYR